MKILIKIAYLKRLNNKRGSLLVMAYLVIMVLLALGAAFIIMNTTESRVAQRNARVMQTFHIAEAGIERAIYDLRQDFVNDSTSPSWADGTINTYTIGPDTANFYEIPYTSTTLNNGSYVVSLKNVAGGEDIWIQSIGTLGDISQTIQVYAKIFSLSPWDNAIFAGAGAAGAMINGNVDIRGSVHILGTGLSPTDLVVDLGGTAELIGNNYKTLAASLLAKVPALDTTVFGGETVSTLNAELRVKRGIVGLSGSATAGEANIAGNSNKETIDGSFVTDGFGGTAGTANVHSDNGWSNGYDLGDSVSFPSLSDPYQSYATYQQYLHDNGLVINDPAALNNLANITPTSSFSYSGPNGSIAMDGSGNMTISGIVYVDGGSFNMNTAGSNKTVNYTGTGSMLVTGNIQINVNLITPGNNSYPNNIIGFMTPNQIGFNEANIDVMGLFYAEDQVTVEKQTDILGTIVSNFFDMGTNVPSIYQVPATADNLPPGMIGQEAFYTMRIISWQKI